MLSAALPGIIIQTHMHAPGTRKIAFDENLCLLCFSKNKVNYRLCAMEQTVHLWHGFVNNLAALRREICAKFSYYRSVSCSCIEHFRIIKWDISCLSICLTKLGLLEKLNQNFCLYATNTQGQDFNFMGHNVLVFTCTMGIRFGDTEKFRFIFAVKLNCHPIELNSKLSLYIWNQ